MGSLYASGGKVCNPQQASLSPDSVVNLDRGDPSMFELYWRGVGDRGRLVISANDSMSYFADTGDVCWFLEPLLADAIKWLHLVVGNAVIEDRHILVGTGSSQLFLAALYALTSPGGGQPVDVVSAAPYYSVYKEATEFLRSGLYKWAGDAYTYDKNGPHIEVVTSPNNPDGNIREAVVNRGNGKLIHDLAYYWPQYAPILETMKSCCLHFPNALDMPVLGLGEPRHANLLVPVVKSQKGWALVKDKDVARKMVKFLEVNSIGVSKESQLRAARILGAITEVLLSADDSANFFEYGQRLMPERWARLREVVKNSKIFSLPEYPQEFCNFAGRYTENYPAFVWLKCNQNIELESFLRAYKILARGGTNFGAGPNHARISMLCRDEEFDVFLERLASIEGDMLKMTIMDSNTCVCASVCVCRTIIAR